MRDKPGGPDDPNEPDDNDQPNQPDEPDKPNEGGRSDQPHNQPGETDQPRRWYDFELTETPEETETRLAILGKQRLRAEGFDNELLDDLFGTGAT